MASCQFTFPVDSRKTLDTVHIVFNESGLRINPTFGDNGSLKLAIIVEPSDTALTKPVQMYKISVMTSGEGCFITSLAPHRTHLVTVSSLPKTIASILFFLVAGCCSDQEQESFKCPLAEAFVAQTNHRQGLLDNMMKTFGVPKDVVETNLE
jgi:hypothetical protein